MIYYSSSKKLKAKILGAPGTPVPRAVCLALCPVPPTGEGSRTGPALAPELRVSQSGQAPTTLALGDRTIC